ncbi:unnamed protein product [Brassica rapa subsp. trilocularis]
MMHLPSYEKLVTPINARELSGGSGLESESVVVHDVEITYWDEGWDDDWDDKNAVKSPGGAANGLTARRLGS